MNENLSDKIVDEMYDLCLNSDIGDYTKERYYDAEEYDRLWNNYKNLADRIERVQETLKYHENEWLLHKSKGDREAFLKILNNKPQ